MLAIVALTWKNYTHGILHCECSMSLGLASRQGNLLDDVFSFCEQALSERSIYAVLHRERDRLFPDEMFADLFSDKGRRSVPPSVLATVMVLQRLEGLSDREAVERYAFDTRWRYAAGVGGYDGDGFGSFAHTVLVDMRARLAASERPRRIFEVTTDVAKDAGLIGAKRVLDSTPLYDAVATMDTITLIRSAIRGLLKAAGAELEVELRGLLESGDDYATTAKPQIDWDDKAGREALVDSRAKDGFRLLAHLDAKELGQPLAEAAELLATVLGQDLETTEDGTFRIARRVAKDRVISTVDPEARHGHKTSARGFDGYKGSIAIDPDSEIITSTVVSAGNAGDAAVAEELIDDLLGDTEECGDEDGGDIGDIEQVGVVATAGPAAVSSKRGRSRATKPARHPKAVAAGARAARRSAKTKARAAARRTRARLAHVEAEAPERPAVYGDAAYGAGAFLDRLAAAGITAYTKTQPPVAPAGRFTKDAFRVDLDADQVTCPAGVTVAFRRDPHGDGIAHFASACASCPLRDGCTAAAGGRTINVGRYERRLADARAEQQRPGWAEEYRATRPKVERKLGHMMRRKHGGRRARVRGRQKVDADFNLLAAAQNMVRLATLGLRSNVSGWAVGSA